MRVLWFTRYGPEGASSRYRAFQLLGPLARDGVESESSILATWRSAYPGQAIGAVNRRAELASIDGGCDVAVVQKEPINPPRLWPLVARRIQRARTPLIWDIDDAVWIGRPGAERMAIEMARTATTVVAGNELLADWANSAGARDVQVIPTCYSPHLQPQRGRIEPPRGPDGLVRIVWIGSPTTAKLLEQKSTALEALMASETTALTTVGGPPPAALRGHPRVRSVAWSTETEHRELIAADYGIAFQPRTPYADHKCGFKIIQYMANGVVPIATDNPVHRQILGGLGALVTDDSCDLPTTVSRPPSHAERQAVRKRWEANYSTPVAVEAWHELLTTTIGKH